MVGKRGGKQSLLSPEQKKCCQAIVDERKGRESQRAAALLGLESGMTQTQAAESSGLTIGQIRYLLTIFRRKAMDMFSNIGQPASLAHSSAGSPEEEVAAEPAVAKEDVPPAETEKVKAESVKGKGKKKDSPKGNDQKDKGKKGKGKTEKKKKGKDNDKKKKAKTKKKK